MKNPQFGIEDDGSLCVTIYHDFEKNKECKLKFHLRTCAPRYLYLSNEAISLYEENDLIMIDEESGISYVKFVNQNIPFEESGLDKKNIMGVRMLKMLNMHLSEEICDIKFNKLLYFNFFQE